VASVRVHFGPELRVLEWAFTILFTVEYALRLFTVHRPLRYAVSVFGLIDLFAILPTYLSIFVPGAQSFLVIRLLRLLRIFRILKLGEYLRESRVLVDALRASRRKIQVFLLSTLTIVVVVGALMYVIEGEEHGFTSIPVSIYWAVVTLTTVGYGDLAPETPLGQGLAVLLMLTGYGIIAVPTGIVTAEIARAASATPVTAQACPACGLGAHEHDAVYCRKCGAKL
jgi:voltage-gated potassium channel